ncbi:MAG: hypothetical protein J5648_09640, partial [Lachnospiraceae bacterium]|nr:hypothetical protein [Lachnospiraceae bacterium]
MIKSAVRYTAWIGIIKQTTDELMQIKGYSNKEMSRIALGTHLGDANDEVSASYRNAIKYAVQNGIYTIDGAINYRGM